MLSESRKYSDEMQNNVLGNYLRSREENIKLNQTIDLRSFSKQQETPKKSKIPDSYLIDCYKVRSNGSISNGYRSSVNIQKENLLKRAEEEATRKIEEI